MCPSSGENYCIHATLVFVTLYVWRLLCWLEFHNKYIEQNCAPVWIYLRGVMTTLYKDRNVSHFVTVIFYKYIRDCCLLHFVGTTFLCSLFILGLCRSYRGMVCEWWILRDSKESSRAISWGTIHEYFLEAMRTTTNGFSQNVQCPSLDPNLEPPKNKIGALILRP